MFVPTSRLFVTRTLTCVSLLLGVASTAHAVPAFARKYQTSCQTCHIVFPKLNAFGEAFRLRGYRLPGETEDMVKQPPVSLGAPGLQKAVAGGRLAGRDIELGAAGRQREVRGREHAHRSTRTAR